MSLRAGLSGALTHSMRAYYLPLGAGLALVASAFMPWLAFGARGVGGVPSVAGLWVLGLGLVAVLLATLSVFTRKNSRHPLLLVGLAALGVLALAQRVLERAVVEQAWAMAQAEAIVQGGAPDPLPEPTVAAGAYLGLVAAGLITAFGLTIVVKQVSRPYAEPEDDDV